MLVAAIMTREVITTEPSRSVRSAMGAMRDGHFRHLPVVSESHLVGIVSDRDLATVAGHCLVRDVMHAEPVYATPDTPVEVAARLLVDNKIGALPVVDNGTDTLVGIVSQTDLFDVLARLLAGDGPSTRLELCMIDMPAELATVARMAHERHIPITSVLTLPVVTHEGRARTVVVRVNSIAVAPFVKALIDAGIHVDSGDD